MRVGVFDSGLGGLTVVQALSRVIKGADIFYVADTKHAPYGEKTPEQILQYSLNITAYFLDEHQIDVLIIACNTATSAAVKTLRERYPELIIIGTEPGIKPALEQTRTKNIGVLATPATLVGEKYQDLVNVLSAKEEVTLYEQACPGLVEQIENGEIESGKTHDMLEGWLHPMRENDVDTIVLGCTHYPLVAHKIEEIMKREMNLIHTGDAIAKRLLALAEEKGYENRGKFSLCIMSTAKIDQEIIKQIIPEYDCFKFISVKTSNF
ncbi:glutamate racemase [Sulfurovum sp. NBC37-1]|uniref:Glutamate racemase n=1 Tax=Sulfurovum sp. (strain NBC37-1) TaxID=387093 RepID=MURI_SULNB|nr:glutamate racemase [Sulfurovum sp. NBC37-1]A6QBL4.1 RecName: Full=Glutamate racemase [Sulfurovum sp. NBC37-1]BAF72873.1 glutamate racemase [Sulfurovum sp. NBC37-1]